MADEEQPDEKRLNPDHVPRRPLTAQDFRIAAYNKEQEERKTRADKIIADHGSKISGIMKDRYLIDDEVTRKIAVEEVARTLAAKRRDVPQISGEDLTRLIRASLSVQYSSEGNPAQDSRNDNPNRAPSNSQADTTANVARDSQSGRESEPKPNNTKITDAEGPQFNQSHNSEIAPQPAKDSETILEPNTAPDLEIVDLGPRQLPQNRSPEDDLKLRVSKSGRTRAEVNDTGASGELSEAQQSRLDNILNNMWRDTANEVTQRQSNNPIRSGRGFAG